MPGTWVSANGPRIRSASRKPRRHARARARLTRVSCAGGIVVPIAEIDFDRALELDGHRLASPVGGLAGGQAHPALPDAVFLDIGPLHALEGGPDPARQ